MSTSNNSDQYPHQRWETRVIHLNIANPTPAQAHPPQASHQPESSNPSNVLFSETYLKQEFPDHYSPPPQAECESSLHPAVQLQGFINGLGQEGWEFVGVYPIGQLVMMFFRRPRLPEVGYQPPVDPRPTHSEPTASSLQAAEMDQIMRRLDALERLAGCRTPTSSSRRSTTRILTGIQLQQLPHAPSLSTQHAATALGLRSAGGLLTYGSRHGFPPGLVKVVSNGLAAIYLGTEKRQRGGSSVRLWKVIPQSSLPAE
jgi:hypothetical protein